jgi:hypothetical protein
MYRNKPETLPRPLRELEAPEHRKALGTAAVRDACLEYFRNRVRITCNACRKRSVLRRWEFVRPFSYVWHKDVGLGKLKGTSTFELSGTTCCLVQCPNCGGRQQVGYSLESAYIELAIEDYKFSPTLLFANYTYQAPPAR